MCRSQRATQFCTKLIGNDTTLLIKIKENVGLSYANPIYLAAKVFPIQCGVWHNGLVF